MGNLSIRVTPRSAKPGLGEWRTDPAGREFLEVRVAAAPADGAANEEVVKLLSKALGIPKRCIAIVSGESARLKRLEIDLSDVQIRERLSS